MSKKIIEASQDGDSINIKTEIDIIDIYHDQDCCESVTIEDCDGDIKDSIGYNLLSVTKEHDHDLDPLEDRCPDSYTWTFIIVKTTYETITYRFYGESNGYYSEDVDIYLNNERVNVVK